MSANTETSTGTSNKSFMSSLLISLGLSRFGDVERKTVTFGDASAIIGSRFWSIVAVVTIAVLWVCSSVYGWTDPTFLPGPGSVWDKFIEVLSKGYRNVTLFEHLGASLFRIVAGFAIGCVVGIPLGLAMGLSNILRGIFDPIVEFFRPIPPLAFIPLVILWFGIGEESKVLLLFLAALWIMAIAARSGVLSVRLSKVHAAANFTSRHSTQCSARNFYWDAGFARRLLGYIGRRRTIRRARGHRSDDLGCPEILYHRNCHHWHYPHWRHRFWYGYPYANARKSSHSLARQGVVGS